jgi:hypothetical protein
MHGPTSDDKPSDFVATTLRYASYLLLWVVLSALGGLLAWLLRINVFDLGIWLRWNPWVVRGVDRWVIFGLGLLWVTYIFAIEGYLREAVPQHRLWPKAKPLLITILILCAISYSLQFPKIPFEFLRNP